VSDVAASISHRQSAAVPVDDAALHLVDLALDEDRGPGDWTTRWIVSARTRADAAIIGKAGGVVAGIGLARSVFLRLDPRTDFEVLVADGDRVAPGQTILRIRGPGRAVLTGERVALNFLQRLSGIATLTRRFVEAIAGTGASILDTRKTTPGWRSLEKAAVRAGGGENHRSGLYDMVLIKENHIAIAGGIAEAVKRVREQNLKKLPITIEVQSIDDLDAALETHVDRLLLDNIDTATMRAIVKRVNRLKQRPLLEASGNMSLERVREVAETGVDFISVGSLTHSAPVLDLTLLIEMP
jgi:nicotinate-nucleotide pyrophosphorylase (carboxylating)